MKRDFLIALALLVLATGASVMATCPENIYDTGNCDSMYIEPWPSDTASTVFQSPGPYIIRVPIYYTHDVTDPTLDSIAAMVIPLCYTRTNATKYCSVSSYWNTVLWGTTGTKPINRSVFRHMPSNQDVQRHNWMMDLFDAGNGEEWNFTVLDLDGTSHYWLSLVPTGSEDTRFGTGAHTLIATVTFKMEDTMNICIDTCLYTPTSHLAFARSGDAHEIIPRMGSVHAPGSYTVCFAGAFEGVREIKGSDDTRPSGFSLSQNYPNPFNPVTNFQFTVSKSTHVKIELFNIVGQKVRILVDEDMKPGVYSADWDSKDENGNTASSGIYFYRMQAGEFSDMKKMVLIK